MFLSVFLQTLNIFLEFYLPPTPLSQPLLLSIGEYSSHYVMSKTDSRGDVLKSLWLSSAYGRGQLPKVETLLQGDRLVLPYNPQ